ncbi:MAG TPA: permease prefix domain 1-containing protein [Terriglobales bacterium]|nr:permease prefix domain 1-containing protein [Terriglobales bacterium]
MSARLEAYLEQFRCELWKRGVIDSRIIEETREHLLDAIQAGVQRGISVEAAESQAFARFGKPEEAAAYFAEENRDMINRLFFMLAKMARVKRRDQGQAAHYHDVA